MHIKQRVSKVVGRYAHKKDSNLFSVIALIIQTQNIKAQGYVKHKRTEYQKLKHIK